MEEYKEEVKKKLIEPTICVVVMTMMMVMMIMMKDSWRSTRRRYGNVSRSSGLANTIL